MLRTNRTRFRRWQFFISDNLLRRYRTAIRYFLYRCLRSLRRFCVIGSTTKAKWIGGSGFFLHLRRMGCQLSSVLSFALFLLFSGFIVSLLNLVRLLKQLACPFQELLQVLPIRLRQHRFNIVRANAGFGQQRKGCFTGDSR